MNHTFYQFENPYLLFLLILVPIIFYFLLKNQSFVSIKFSSVELFEGIPKSLKEKLYFLPALLRCLALSLFIIALARPQHGNSTSEIISEGIDIVLTIDTSGSMKALDFELDGKEANRLDVVKSVVSDFVDQRKYDRMGMIVFGEEAYTQCPLTLDGNTIKQFLDWVEIGIAGDGTSIGRALATSVKRLKDEKTKSKIIILLTDGINNDMDITPKMAAEIAKDHNIKVYTIGVGSRGPVPYPEMTLFGMRKISVRLDLDEESLKEIADITGGLYFRATDSEELKKIYSTIDQLEKTEVKVKEYQNFNDLFSGFVFLGLLLLFVEFLLANTYLLKIP